MRRHEFRIDADATAEEGSNARCINCGMGVSSCLRKSDDGHLLEPVKVVRLRQVAHPRAGRTRVIDDPIEMLRKIGVVGDEWCAAIIVGDAVREAKARTKLMECLVEAKGLLNGRTVEDLIVVRRGGVTNVDCRAYEERHSPLFRCASNSDGDCYHFQCPQHRDGEPGSTGRSCPLPKRTRDET